MFSDDSKGTSTQTIVNDVESENERSILNSNKRDSIHSDWSDLIAVNEEAKYRKINRSEPNIIGVATTSAASATETAKKPSVPPIKKTVRECVSVIYAQTYRLGKLVDKITIYLKHYCQSSCSAVKSTRKRRRGRIGP